MTRPAHWLGAAACAATLACGPPREASIVEQASATPRQRASTSATVTASRRTAIVDATSRIAPSVVSVNVASHRKVEAESMFDLFFVPEQREQLVQGYGTGFALRPGIIVTNQHVVDNAESITVSLPDGTDLPAKLLGEDAMTDIAVLQVTKKDIPSVTTGKSTDLLIGEWVVALGNPYTYLLGNSEPTVTAGVVSATGRNVVPNREQSGIYLDMIQTDAAINPGNSGGPLVNASGEVVGVNSFILTQSGGSIGLGFAIPIERVVRIADEIIRNGAVRRAWIGIEVAGAMRDWKSQGGVKVTSVAPGSPAARAGLTPNAILVEANGRKLRNYLDWESVKLDLHVSDTVSIRVKTGTATTLTRIVSADLPSVTAAKVSVIKGLEVITVTAAVQAERRIVSDRGALIFRITEEVTRATGLTEGDVIRRINQTEIKTAAQVAGALESMGSKQVFRIYFERQGQPAYTDLAFR
ncbi:MAG: trypsin-like peptidase domain-containing protein [Gemmatimonadota bacterium]